MVRKSKEALSSGCESSSSSDSVSIEISVQQAKRTDRSTIIILSLPHFSKSHDCELVLPCCSTRSSRLSACYKQHLMRKAIPTLSPRIRQSVEGQTRPRRCEFVQHHICALVDLEMFIVSQRLGCVRKIHRSHSLSKVVIDV